MMHRTSLFALVALATGCGAGSIRVLEPGCSDEIDPDDFSASCPNDSLEVRPGERVQLVFEAYATGAYAGSYDVSYDVDLAEDVELSTTSVELEDGVLEPITLSFTLPTDACGSGFAGIAVQGDKEFSNSSVTLSVMDVDDTPLFCN